MGHHIGIGVFERAHRLVHEPLEQRQHAASGLACAVEKFDRRLVGQGFLRPHIGHEIALHQSLRSKIDAGARLRRLRISGCRSCRDRGRADQHSDDGLVRRLLHLLAHARQMTARDMARLMRQNANHFIRCLRLDEQTGVDEDALASGHEGVDARLPDEKHLGRAFIEPRRLE